MDAYIWLNDEYDACITRRDGTVEVIDLPDEMYEDLLHMKMRRVSEKTREDLLKRAFPKPEPVDLDALTKEFDRLVGWIPPPLSATPVDPDDDELDELDMEWDEDEVTQPMGPSFEQMQDWKAKGLCPKCGDVTRESAVGICRDHGKFMG